MAREVTGWRQSSSEAGFKTLQNSHQQCELWKATAVGAENVSRATAWVAVAPMMGTAMVARDEEFAVMLAVQHVACLRPSELCTSTAGQVIWPLRRSGTPSWALLLAPLGSQEDLKASKTAGFDESILLDGKLSVALGKALARYTAGKASSTLLSEPIIVEVRAGFRQVGRDFWSERDHDSSVLGTTRW